MALAVHDIHMEGIWAMFMFMFKNDIQKMTSTVEMVKTFCYSMSEYKMLASWFFAEPLHCQHNEHWIVNANNRFT